MDETQGSLAAAVAAYDQAHAEAIALLTRARAFFVVVDEGEGTLAAAAAAINGLPAVFVATAAQAATYMTKHSIVDLLESCPDESEEE
jgi:hypothetical protein